LKIEINSREHFSVFAVESIPFSVSSRWFSGRAVVSSYRLEELLGTKLRALYQRKKGRDLFDLATTLREGDVDCERIMEAFTRYMEHEGAQVTRAELERNLHSKLRDPVFTSDLKPLLAPGQTWSFEEGARVVRESLLVLLPGDPWKGLTD
jgi:predicted nucleotidyltransferase component of viral defense system